MREDSTYGRSLLERRVIALVGGYGAGKTQISLSLALRLAGLGRQTALVDLDLINPYFRSREMAAQLEREGIEVIRPAGDLALAENPSLVPGIEGALRNKRKNVLLDAGGDEAGARILGRFHRYICGSGLATGAAFPGDEDNSLPRRFREEEPDLNNEERAADIAQDAAVLQVVNVFRPFSRTVEEILELRRGIEEKARCKVQGWINNSNLQSWTTGEEWRQAGEIIEELAERSGLPLAGCGVDPVWAGKVGLDWEPEWIPVRRFLNLGWRAPL